MVKNGIFIIPHDGVEAIETMVNGISTHVTQDFGNVYIELKNDVYFRDYNELLGLIRMSTGVDVIVKRKWFDEFVNLKLND
jgi:hypothetical protein